MDKAKSMRMRFRSPRRLTLAVVVLALGPGFSAARGDDRPTHARRWFYSMSNVQVAENADRLVDLIARAKGAGYNGFVLADYKLNILDRVPRHYFTNLERVRKAAADAGLEIVPAIFPIGYGNGLLAHDPNLAEGLPVIDAPFTVVGDVAKLAADPRTTIRNGDFESAEGDRFAGFSFQDGPGSVTFRDTKVTHRGLASCRISAEGSEENRRVVQRVAVRPHACYRLSAWVRSEACTGAGSFRLLALAASQGSRPLTFFEGGVRPTQEWRQVEVVFNSLGNEAVNIYAGIWGRGKGTLWIDELTIEELGPVNVLRRAGCPLVVASHDGATRFEEGRDFARVVDPRLGNVPYAGEFEFGHDPAEIRILPGSRIRDGQRLRVSWYHPVLTHGSQIMVCPSEPRTYELLRDQARRVNQALMPRTVFMSHDEIRVLNWCKACRDRNITPGAILADNARRCVAILNEVNPGAEVVVWSDMFDPSHNARANYYLVNGTLEGSWEGLPSSVTIANWNGGHKKASLEFFARRGHKQVLAGYYDVDDLSGFTSWDDAARGVKGVDGFMYTTWQHKFDLLERYGKAMRREP